MQKTKIEWVKNPDGSQGYTVNPIKGACPMKCTDPRVTDKKDYYCYASGQRGLYNRFKWDKSISYKWDEMESIAKMPPRGFFVCSTFEWLWSLKAAEKILNYVRRFDQHRFYLLTKLPHNLGPVSQIPSNCIIGVSVCTQSMLSSAIEALDMLDNRIPKFISFEPLMGDIDPGDSIKGIDQVIIGSRDQPYRPPTVDQVNRIVDAADRWGIDVFLKDNLKKLMGPDLRQELAW